MKLDTTTFSLRELLDLYQIYMRINGIPLPLTETMKERDKSTGQWTIHYDLSTMDPLYKLIKRVCPDSHIDAVEFMLKFCGPPVEDLPFVVM